MLQSIRDKAQGWFAWLIVALISVPFALWGIQEYLGVGAEPVVASVNERDITEREFDYNYNRFRMSLRQQLGDSYSYDLFQESKLRADVLNSMVRDELVLQAADGMGVRVGDNLVRGTIFGMPGFQVNGQFDTAAYERGLRQRSYSPAEFQEEIRQALMTDQVTRAITGSEIVTERELEEMIRLREQKRELSYLLLPAADFIQSGEIDEAEISTYYAANQGQFMAPERVRVDYIELKMDQVSEGVGADEEALKDFFEERQGEYTTLEQRRASHILIAVEGESEEAEKAALEKLQDAMERLQAGEDFAAVAKDVSQDPGSAEQGGDLGLVEAGMMDIAFDKALFATGKGEISEPVRTDFGFHLIKVTEIIAGSEKSFEDVREEVLAAYQANEAEGIFHKYAERLVDLSYENAGTLEPAADALGLKVTTSDWLTRADADKLPGSAKAINSAFSEDVISAGNNSELIEISHDHVVVLRVHEHEMSAVRPLEQVRDDIIAALQQQQGKRLAKETGDSLLARLRQGESLEQVTSNLTHKLEQPVSVGRSGSKLPPTITRRLFSMPRPDGDNAVYGHAVLGNGDFALIVLHKVEDGSLAAKDEKALLSLRVSQARAQGRDTLEHFMQYLHNKAEVTIRQSQESYTP
ncbi:Peptidyl-prolyl cis-trans isomerase PpiD [hydrothermal vent metagenome]|uniref:Periplasmic chaperone PpiD n=1 Tax=hydrothermal vent metagenome TaxID=652676 RepID=A0A3B1B785_9ZZZZ